jgi:dienelactone hydrolase
MWLLLAVIPFLYHTRFNTCWPRVQKFFEDVRTHEGASIPMGTAAFCWGGPYAFKLSSGIQAANGKPLIDAAFAAHPSSLAIPQDIEQVRKPMSVAIGTKDVLVDEKQGKRIEGILKSIDELESEVKFYDGAGHGFAVRGDKRNPKAAEQLDAAEAQAIGWFKRYFARVSY